jgi:pimeloyl-ACP methyl ester carboxylesterase
MDWRDIAAPTLDGILVGRVGGDGPPVLLLHGGPSLPYDYLAPLAEELADGYTVAWYQQRSLTPSVRTGPFSVEQHIIDLTAILDALGWERAWLVGHSWGGHLAVATAVARPDRVLGVMAVDPLGAVGDGGAEEFGATLVGRISPEFRVRAEEADRRSEAETEPTRRTGGTATGLARLLLRSGKRAGDASDGAVPRGPPRHLESLIEGLPALERSLSSITAPTAFVHGSDSPMPLTASTDTAALIPGAQVDIVSGAGHFVWYERPGAVRRSLDQLTAS